MLLTIYRKLAASLLALLLVLGLGAVSFYLWTTGVYLDEVEQRLHRQLADHLVKEQPVLVDGEVREENLKHLFHMLMVINPQIELYLLDPSGQILAFDAPPGHVKLHRVDLSPVHAFLAGRRLPLRGEDPRDPNQPKIFSAAPICAPAADVPAVGASAGCDLQGYLYVVLKGEQVRSVVDRLRGSLVLKLAAASAVGALVATAALALLLVRLTTSRLERLDRRMQALQLTDTATPALRGSPPGSVANGDEIDRLEETFERMQTRLAQQVDEVRQADRRRRELVANVSHDLRTPIASLQGYLETLMLREGALLEGDRRSYLQVAFGQSERLSTLVNELFELAKLDSGDAVLEREPVSLAELAQDVAQRYQLEARARGVTLATDLEASAPSVAVDLRRMEGVLGNLIENALRHTEAGGRVEVAVAQNAGRVRVRISDDGCGIPEHELPRIFDRSYRGRHESEARADGSGLGLAIAKRVVELHGSRLDVSSQQGVGTSLSFELNPG